MVKPAGRAAAFGQRTAAPARPAGHLDGVGVGDGIMGHVHGHARRAPTINTSHIKATTPAWQMSGAAASTAPTMMDAKKLAGLGVSGPACAAVKRRPRLSSSGRRGGRDGSARKQHGKRHLRRRNRREGQRFLRGGRVSALGGEATGPASKFLMAPSRLKAVRPGAIPSRLPCRRSGG